MKKGRYITLALLVIGMACAVLIWCSRDINRIVDGGPFDQHFEDGLYPYKEEEITNWFHTSLPSGTTKEEAIKILSPSFTVDLTTGQKVMVERKSDWAGSQSTEVTIQFTNGRISDVKVQQHWAYL